MRLQASTNLDVKKIQGAELSNGTGSSNIAKVEEIDISIDANPNFEDIDTFDVISNRDIHQIMILLLKLVVKEIQFLSKKE